MVPSHCSSQCCNPLTHPLLLKQPPVQYDAADIPLSHSISGRPELSAGQPAGEPRVELLPVQPWNFTLPLNASVIHAHKLGASKIVFISLEITVSTDEISQMLNLWSNGMCHTFPDSKFQ